MTMRALVLFLSFSLTLTTLAQVPTEPAARVEGASAEADPTSQLRVFTNADGTGTANALARWIDSDTLGDSVVQQVNGMIGIGPISWNYVSRSLTVDTGNASSGVRIYRTSLTSFPYFDMVLDSNATPHGILQVGDSISWRTLSLNPSGGGVGVGTTAPLHRFDVHAIPLLNGDTRELMGLYDTSTVAAGVGGGLVFGGKFNSAGTIAQQFASIEGFKENGTDGNYAGALSFNTRVAGGQPTERMRINSNGNVGIGTTGPSERLEVLAGSIYVNAEDSGLIVDAAGNKRVGLIKLSGLPTELRYMSSIPFRIRRVTSGVLKNATTSDIPMTFTAAGNVGIGLLNPNDAYKLDVAGPAHFSSHVVVDGNIAAKYQDLAEWVPSRDDLAPGTVVVLDPEAGNGVLASSTAYDTTVAGVVSMQPGIILGEAGAAKEQVATTGRVRVKVDASRGSIRVGDLLVTSDKPGLAMRSDAIEIQGRKFHQPGTIIGKALQPLASGEGEILVLLSLQ